MATAYSFTDAVEIVRREVERAWVGPEEIYIPPDWGYQTDTHWSPIVGTRAWLVERDWLEAPDGGPIFLVDKETGELSTQSSCNILPLLDSIRPYGKMPRWFR